MNETALMKMLERRGEFKGQARALGSRQAMTQQQLALDRPGRVGVGIDLLAPGLVVGQFHHIIEIALRFVAADVQDVHLARVRP